jgi:hypothetical protein
LIDLESLVFRAGDCAKAPAQGEIVGVDAAAGIKSKRADDSIEFPTVALS